MIINRSYHSRRRSRSHHISRILGYFRIRIRRILGIHSFHRRCLPGIHRILGIHTVHRLLRRIAVHRIRCCVPGIHRIQRIHSFHHRCCYGYHRIRCFLRDILRFRHRVHHQGSYRHHRGWGLLRGLRVLRSVLLGSLLLTVLLTGLLLLLIRRRRRRPPSTIAPPAVNTEQTGGGGALHKCTAIYTISIVAYISRAQNRSKI